MPNRLLAHTFLAKNLAPILDQIAEEHGDKLRIVQLNADENPKTAARYEISSIPVLRVYQSGSVKKTIIGARPKTNLERELAEFIS